MLQLFALELHVADAALYAHAESAQLILGELFDPNAANNVSDMGSAGGFTDLEQRRARMLEVCHLYIALVLRSNSQCAQLTCCFAPGAGADCIPAD
jgi:hypothetical protein